MPAGKKGRYTSLAENILKTRLVSSSKAIKSLRNTEVSTVSIKDENCDCIKWKWKIQWVWPALLKKKYTKNIYNITSTIPCYNIKIFSS